MSRSSAVVALLVCAASFGTSTRAFGQPTDTERSIAAELFRDAKQLMEKSRWAEACPKLAESQRLDPGGGTLLNLGVCLENSGKVATAWNTFKEALAAARRDGREDRVAFALERISALEPRLSRLKLSVRDDAATAGLEVRLDGAVVPKVAWGSSLPVDPGRHTVRATAPGHDPWEATVQVAGEGVSEALVVPPLVPARREAPVRTPEAAGPLPSRVADSKPAGGSTTRTVGWILVGTGVAGLAVGTYYGFRAISKRKESDDLCVGGCTEDGVARFEEAKDAARVSNIAVAVGLVATGAGVYLSLSSSGQSQQTARIGVVAGPRMAFGALGMPW